MMTDIPYSEFQRTSRQLASIHGVEMVPAEVEQTMGEVLALYPPAVAGDGMACPSE